jgi:hypothetical protein
MTAVIVRRREAICVPQRAALPAARGYDLRNSGR